MRRPGGSAGARSNQLRAITGEIREKLRGSRPSRDDNVHQSESHAALLAFMRDFLNEYALIASLIAVFIITAVTTVGG